MMWPRGQPCGAAGSSDPPGPRGPGATVATRRSGASPPPSRDRLIARRAVAAATRPGPDPVVDSAPAAGSPGDCRRAENMAGEITRGARPVSYTHLTLPTILRV